MLLYILNNNKLNKNMGVSSSVEKDQNYEIIKTKELKLQYVGNIYETKKYIILEE
jgi:hypothetical protein